MSSADTARLILMYVVLPLWLAAGLADAWCHRRSDIEHTSGVKESLIHLLMLSQVGLPLMASLFLEINTLMIGFMIGMFFLHQATALWDSSYAASRREIRPIEQHVHSFLEMIPLMAIALIVVMHPVQFAALFPWGPEPGLGLDFKREPLPLAYRTVAVCSAFVFGVLPYLMELRRDVIASRRARLPAS